MRPLSDRHGAGPTTEPLMTAWKITYRYPAEPKLYVRTVNADSREGALRTFHACGAHSDIVLSVVCIDGVLEVINTAPKNELYGVMHSSAQPWAVARSDVRGRQSP